MNLLKYNNKDTTTITTEDQGLFSFRDKSMSKVNW